MSFVLTLILAAIAVPNLKKYSKRAKTSEAKVILASLYAAEMMYYAENGVYTEDFSSMGFELYDPEQARYKVGFTSFSPEFAAVCEDCFANADGFKAVAFGDINDDGELDVWTVTDEKVYTHVVED